MGDTSFIIFDNLCLLSVVIYRHTFDIEWRQVVDNQPYRGISQSLPQCDLDTTDLQIWENTLASVETGL